MILEERLVAKIREVQQRLTAAGELPPKDKLDAYYSTFRRRFGPERLKSLDGGALLQALHSRDRNTRDSLVYWLEFKNDDEFPAVFGSIAGGSALKFGIYQSSQTGQWMTGSPRTQRAISEEEAIESARKHREQLARGAELLEKLPADGSDEDYRSLQTNMDKLAPDVGDTAWGHKYLYLLYPDKLDDFHVEYYQRFYLTKLLQLPPEGDGRYIPAGRFVAISRELDMPVKHLTWVLGSICGRPHRYWRIGTSDGTKSRNRWLPMRDGGCVAIGWRDLGDLSQFRYDQQSRDAIVRLVSDKYHGSPQLTGKEGKEVLNFATVISEGDLVLASDGATVLGIGKVIGGYSFDGTSDFPHRRPVEWLSLEEWRPPSPEGLRTTVYELGSKAENLIEVERRLLSGPLPPPPGNGHEGHDVRLPSPAGIQARIDLVLERKGQVILYGPPGTGKTHWAEETARELAARSWFKSTYAQLSPDQKGAVAGSGNVSATAVRMCCFHPAYGYEDFIEGYRPEAVNDVMKFELRDGVFKKLCKDAAARPDRKFFLIIDEINRGDIPRIFGELLTILEKNKRGKPILLPLTDEPFHVPPNVYVIGTMNTADRSIALLDTALRRRFGFIELMPDPTVLGDAALEGIPLGPWLESINRRICEHVGRDARNLQIGHSYLLEGGRPIADIGRFSRVLREDILPLLEEYCYEDYARLEKILGRELVDVRDQRFRNELFEPARREDLIHALLAPQPGLTASTQAIAAEAGVVADERDAPETNGAQEAG
ncbi:MAG: AAA family ATPase [Chloroflexota bacterium]